MDTKLRMEREQNPLQMVQILPSIFACADVPTLKILRQVCKLWEKEATPELLKKVHLSVPSRLHNDPDDPCEESNLPPGIPGILPGHQPKQSWQPDREEEEVENLQGLLSLSFPRHPLSWLVENCDYTHSLNCQLPSTFSSRAVRCLKYGGGDNFSNSSLSSCFTSSSPSSSFYYPAPKNLCCEFSLKMNTEHLNLILSQLPYLQELETCCLDFSPEQSWLQDKSENEPENEENGHRNQNRHRFDNLTNSAKKKVNEKLKKLLEKLESLQDIRLNFWLSAPLLRQYIEHAGALKTVSSLRINNEQVLRLYANSKVQFNVQRVEVMLDSESSPDILREFLRSVSPTLQRLSLSFYRRQRRARRPPLGAPAGNPNANQNGNPGQNPGEYPARRSILDFNHPAHLPWTLKQLNTLEISLIDDNLLEVENEGDLGQNLGQGQGQGQGQLEFNMWKSLAIALQLPTLKNLTIQGRITNRFDEMLRQFQRHRRSRTLSSESLEKLTVCPSIFSSHSIFSSNLWPNLKILSVYLDLDEKATPGGIQAIFKELPKLWKLELGFYVRDRRINGSGDLEKKNVGKSKGCDELITGMKFLNGEEKVENTTIVNLKHLTSLKLEARESIPESRSITNFSIYNGLMHLKSLRNVQISSQFISSQAITDLKQELGPYANICINLGISPHESTN